MSYTIAQHASKYGIIPLKKYSQNFIFDSTLCDKIVRVSGINKGDLVLEIGPGTAGLTKSILKNSPKNLTVIEMDTRCIPLLEDIKIDFPSLNIINADALDYDLSLLNSNEINIISNLPYQIGTELVVRWLKKAKLISSITVMLQKEVVERIRAQVSTKAYGRLSVICQLICDIEKGFDVSPQAFYPQPKIHSAIVKLIPRQVQVDEVLFEKIELVTKLAFGQRRKMLKSSLSSIHKNIENILLELGINSTVRAENLTPQAFLSIAQRL